MARDPKFAGSFYPAFSHEIRSFIKHQLPEKGVYHAAGCVLPHAGWVFSGMTALKTLGAINNPDKIRHCVIFGAVHHYGVHMPVVSPQDGWKTPLGNVSLDMAFYRKVSESGIVDVSSDKHREEHSIEVLLPFIQYLMPEAEILPVLVPYTIQSKLQSYIELFSALKSEDTIFVASSDFSHYGLNYGNTKMGTGMEAVAGIRKEDMRFAELVKNGSPEEIIPYAVTHESACGAGGIALMKGILDNVEIKIVDYTNSCEVYPQGGCSSFVTYCGMIFVKDQVSS